LRRGDRIYGTVERDGARRYAVTEVLDHWATVRPVYRVTLADGTDLLTSADHRFLSDAGWRHVTAGPAAGRRRTRSGRPHLTLDCRLMGTGRLASPPADTIEYRRGYVCGLLRGGPPARAPGVLAAAFDERLSRRETAPASAAGVTRGSIVVASDDGFAGSSLVVASDEPLGRSPIAAEALARLRVFLRTPGDLAGDLAASPARPAAAWCTGFLAGLFDAGGVCDEHGVRLEGAEAAMIEATFALDRLAFRFTVDRAAGAWRVRLSGGVAADLRFLHAVDPVSAVCGALRRR